MGTSGQGIVWRFHCFKMLIPPLPEENRVANFALEDKNFNSNSFFSPFDRNKHMLCRAKLENTKKQK